MFSISRRLAFACILTIATLVWLQLPGGGPGGLSSGIPPALRHHLSKSPSALRWRKRRQHFPVRSFTRLPRPGGARGGAGSGPSSKQQQPLRIQFDFTIAKEAESAEAHKRRDKRLAAVREAFKHSWEGYKKHAWLKDEVAPLSGDWRTTFNGWGATLIDSLDTLYIMGFNEEFDEAVKAVASIDFSTPRMEVLNVFETTIRYLGGLLSAYDLSQRKVLLEKALELGEVLYASFDTPNRMPIARFNWTNALSGRPQSAAPVMITAEVGSLSLEFTRLSQLSGDPKYYDAISRITDILHSQQATTRLPGLWPLSFNAAEADSTQGHDFSLGAMADSLYEYLPKEYLLLGGPLSKSKNGRGAGIDQYKQMYDSAISTASQILFFRPMVPTNADILFAGSIKMADSPGQGGTRKKSEMQHLTCFVGGMVALASKVFRRPEDMSLAKRLTEGCVWAYEAVQPAGIAPEVFTAVECSGPNVNDSAKQCEWDETRWLDAVQQSSSAEEVRQFNASTPADIARAKRLPKGMVNVPSRDYRLRPEALESVFVLYRLTGDPALLEAGWKMFSSIERLTRTDIAHAAIMDVTAPRPPQADRAESYFTGETLKYAYLLFADPASVMSLDEWVFNTEAHPFRLVPYKK